MKTIGSPKLLGILDDSQLEARFSYLLQRNTDLLKLQHAPVDYKTKEEACDWIHESFDITLTVQQLEELLSIYKHVSVGLIMHGMGDTVVKEDLMSMVSNFFVGTDCPIYGDNLTPIEIKRFFALVKKQAKSMGYTIEED